MADNESNLGSLFLGTDLVLSVGKKVESFYKTAGTDSPASI